MFVSLDGPFPIRNIGANDRRSADSRARNDLSETLYRICEPTPLLVLKAGIASKFPLI